MPRYERRAAHAIERLPQLERLVFTYFAYEKLEDAEIAELLDLAEEDVEKLRAEATQRVSDADRGENLRPRAERALSHTSSNCTASSRTPTIGLRISAR